MRNGLGQAGLPRATWPALAETLAAEGSFEVASGVALALVALGVGVGGLHAPSPLADGALLTATTVVTLLARRSPRLRRVVREVRHGLAALREPRRFVRHVLPWQVAGRLLRLASLGCFLYAFGLPAAPAVIIAATVVQGSGRRPPIPGAGTAAAAAALVATLPAVAGHPVDAEAVGALAIAQPALLTLVGVTVSLALLTVQSARAHPASADAGRPFARAAASRGQALASGRRPSPLSPS